MDRGDRGGAGRTEGIEGGWTEGIEGGWTGGIEGGQTGKEDTGVELCSTYGCVCV